MERIRKPGLSFYSLLFVATIFWTHDVEAGAAVCVAKVQLSSTLESDVQYFLRWGPESAEEIEAMTRADWQAKYGNVGPPARCAHSGQLKNGWMVVIEFIGYDDDDVDYSRFGFGFGENKAAAVLAAIENLRSRDASWRTEDGYQEIDSQEF